MVVPTLVATVFQLDDGAAASHHVVEERGDLHPYTLLAHLCAEHLLDGCVGCGRSPGHHAELAQRVAAGLQTPDGQCGQHRPRAACGCRLERWQP